MPFPISKTVRGFGRLPYGVCGQHPRRCVKRHFLWPLGQESVVEFFTSQSKMDCAVRAFLHRNDVFLAHRQCLGGDNLVPLTVERKREVILNGACGMAREDRVETPFLLIS